jgi:hypothetical protein
MQMRDAEYEQLVKLYSPRGEGELALLRSVLDRVEIPYFVQNNHFGALHVGPEVDLFNRKTILVPEARAEAAQELILDFLKVSAEDRAPWTLKDRVRMVLELLLFGWFIPGRMTRRK